MRKLLNLEVSDDKFLFLYLNNEFDKLNISLSEEQLDYFVKQLLKKDVKSINLNFTEEQLINTKYSKEEDTIDDILQIIQNKDNRLENFMKNIDDEFSHNLVNLADRLANNRLETFYKEKPEYFTKLQNENISVAQNIDDIWGHSLDLFELQINTAVEITSHFDISKLNNYDDNIDLFDALQRLQGRACLISNEILALLRAGYTDGAYARWRTLHETMVLSYFLSDKDYGGNETAKRYLDYSIVNDKKEAEIFNDYASLLDEEKINNTKLLELDSEVKKLKLQYGEDFTKGDYNWALNVIKPKNKNFIQFWEIEKVIDFKYIKPFYKSASNNIHTGSSSLYFHRGLPAEYADKILMGASSFGIETPCNLASYCINITTSNLVLITSQTLEQQVQISLLAKIREDLEESLFKIELKV